MKRFAAVISLIAMLSLYAGRVSAYEITITPAEPDVENCYPFGEGQDSPLDEPIWPPYAGFIYQNVPPFNLKAGDTLAFDLGAVASQDVQLDIELAATTSNGGIDPVLPFTKVVSNTQTPLNPRGDDIIGDFEMQFTAERDFNFPGGGLIIRFSNPSPAYAATHDCDQVLVKAFSTDPSGFFIQRFFNDLDGLPPYIDNLEPGNTSGFFDDIGGFRVTSDSTRIPTLSEWGMIAAAAVLGLAGIFYAARRKRVIVNS